MPLVRAQVRNEYGLGVPELYKEVNYKEVNKEDPKAVLDGVAVSGLVGILRQLGDLADFAAEVFHGLQEEVMSTASRSHKLMVRVQRIEAALPPLEKAVLAQTSHIHFAYTTGSEWHPRIRNEKNHFIYNDLPRFIMDSYEVCRDPPRLHLLDKFDAGGPGSCLKRYSDPTYFKRASGISIHEDAEKVPRDKKTHKSKKRRPSHRKGELSRGASLSNHSGRMQLTSPIVNGQTSSSQTASTGDIALKSDVGEHSNSFDSRTGSGYIECVTNLSTSVLPGEQDPKEVSSGLVQEAYNDGPDFPVEQTRVVDYSFSKSSSQEQIAPGSCVMWDEKAEILESKADNWERDEVLERSIDVEVQETEAANLEYVEKMNFPFIGIDAPQSSAIENQNDEFESEPDNYMDALNTIESESENEIECHTKQKVDQWSESNVNCQTKWEMDESDYANYFRNGNGEDEMHVVANNVDYHPSMVQSSASFGIMSNSGMSRSLPDPVPSKNFASEQMPQVSGNLSDPDHSPSTDICMRVPSESFASDQMPQVSGKPSDPDHSPNTDLCMRVPSEKFMNEQMPQMSGKASDTDHSPSTDLCMRVPSENFASEQMLQISGKSSDPDHSPSTDLCKRVCTKNNASEQMPQISGNSSDPDHSPGTDLCTRVPPENFASQHMPQISGNSSDPDHSPSTDLCTRVPSMNFASEQMPQISGKSSDPGHLASTNLCVSDEVHNGSQAESVISDPSSPSGSTVSDTHDATSDRMINSVNDSQNSCNRFSGVYSVGLWTNGVLLGLQPSKPPDFALSATGQGSAAKTSEAFDPPNQTLTRLHNDPKGNSGALIENAENTKATGSCSEKTSSHPFADIGANLEKSVNSHCNKSLDNFDGIGLSRNTSLPHGNKHPVNPNVGAESIESDEDNDDNSSTMFGLGHKLLVNGFRRKLSVCHNGETQPDISTKSRVLEQRNGNQGIPSEKIPWTAFSEQIGNGSPVNSYTSSPPLEHMKISFNPIDGFETTKLRLQFPDGNHHQESASDMFPSFQLVPLSSFPKQDVPSDTDDETFCRSSPYISDDCLSHCSESNSEQWESGETPESKDPELCDALSRLSLIDSVSSSLQVVEAANKGIHVNGGNKSIISGTGAQPSLSVSLDLPGFDAINPVPCDKTISNPDQKNQVELQNTIECTPLPPPPPPPAQQQASNPCFNGAEEREHALSESLKNEPPPAQWRASKPCFNEAEERQHALSESLRHELDLKLLGSNVSQKPKSTSVNQQRINDEAIALKPEKKVDQGKLNGQREANQLTGGRGMDEKEDFLHQIRTKSFNLRPTATGKPPIISGPQANVKVTAILQKANAIRQAVGSDDDDNWSDT